jgi:hypothetical protein
MRNGWYIAYASVGEYDDAEYILFELTDKCRKDVANLLAESKRLAEKFDSWGSVCMHDIVHLIVLKSGGENGLDIPDDFDDGINAGPVFIGADVDIDGIPGDCVWRSDCHAVRVMSSGSVYLRGLSKYSSAEAETDDLAPLLGLENEDKSE